MEEFNVKDVLQNKKIMIVVIVCLMLILFLITFVVVESLKIHTVKEILYDVPKSELFVVRDDGKEMKVDLEIANRDKIFRQGEFLIHQHYKEEQNIITTVYNVDAKTLLTSVFKREGNVIYYKDNQNFIFDNGSFTTVVKDGKETNLDKVCRESNYIDGTLLCLASNGTAYITKGTETTILKDKEGKEVYVVTFAVDQTNKKVHFGTATKDEVTVNKVLILNENLDINTAEEYIIDYIPTRFTIQSGRVVLNSRVITTGETQDSFKLFVLNNGIMPIQGYRHSLMIVY